MLIKKTNLSSALDHMISVSDLGRGQASKVVYAVEKNKDQYIIVKNNKPQAVIISIDEYMSLMEAREELELYTHAQKRMENATGEESIGWSDVLSEFGITPDELDEIKDEVVLE